MPEQEPLDMSTTRIVILQDGQPISTPIEVKATACRRRKDGWEVDFQEVTVKGKRISGSVITGIAFLATDGRELTRVDVPSEPVLASNQIVFQRPALVNIYPADSPMRGEETA